MKTASPMFGPWCQELRAVPWVGPREPESKREEEVTNGMAFVFLASLLHHQPNDVFRAWLGVALIDRLPLLQRLCRLPHAATEAASWGPDANLRRARRGHRPWTTPYPPWWISHDHDTEKRGQRR
ncbi:hypothetical protein QOT17_009440 [Balamuthia mandrillaris]